MIADDHAIADAQIVLFQLSNLGPATVVESDIELVATFLFAIVFLNLVADHATCHCAGCHRGGSAVAGTDIAAGHPADDDAKDGAQADVLFLIPQTDALDLFNGAARVATTSVFAPILVSRLSAASSEQQHGECCKTILNGDTAHEILVNCRSKYSCDSRYMILP